MSEENKIDTQTSSKENTEKNPSTEAVDKNVPYDRFAEVNSAKNNALDSVGKLQAQLDAINKVQKEKEQAELVEQGKAKEALGIVSKERDDYKKQAEQWTAYQTSKRENLMEKLSDDSDKSIAEGLSLDKLELYVNKISKVNAPSTSTARATTGNVGEFGGFDTIEEFAVKDPDGALKYLESNTKGYIK